jgi:hypothetical protein
MRMLSLFAALAAVVVTGVTPAGAQTSALMPAPMPAPTSAPASAPASAQLATKTNPQAADTRQSTLLSSSNQLIERIRVENADVRIDEVRFGGETRSISVMPKSGFPAYDVKPSTGERTWKVLGF